jgi:hypothetical protein
LQGVANVTELDDFAELLLDLALLLAPSTGSGTFEELLVMAASEPPSPCFWLDILVSLSLEEDDFAFPLDEDSSSQSLHTLDDESSEGRTAKSLSSSLQARKKNAKKSARTRCIDPRRSLS